jgi:transposase-like protein
MMHDRKKYRENTQEFRNEAVRCVIEKGRTLADVAREFGIQEKKLKRWKNHYIRILSMHFLGRHH